MAFLSQHLCPSGLRGSTQVRVYSYSGVRIPASAATLFARMGGRYCTVYFYIFPTSYRTLFVRAEQKNRNNELICYLVVSSWLSGAYPLLLGQ